MALLQTPLFDPTFKAPDFELLATDGKLYSLADIKGPNGLLVVFMCNHCPYVKGVMDRLPQTLHQLQQLGIGVAAINANDAQAYPEDSFENMQRFAADHRFTFPYLYDQTQETARYYGAVCTPDFFGFNANLELRYRGRLDSSGKNPASANTEPELLNAMSQIAQHGSFSGQQFPSMGCSIKWQQPVVPA